MDEFFCVEQRKKEKIEEGRRKDTGENGIEETQKDALSSRSLHFHTQRASKVSSKPSVIISSFSRVVKKSYIFVISELQ